MRRGSSGQTLEAARHSARSRNNPLRPVTVEETDPECPKSAKREEVAVGVHTGFPQGVLPPHVHVCAHTRTYRLTRHDPICVYTCAGCVDTYVHRQTALHCIAPHRYCVVYTLKVCGNPAWSTSTSSVFPIAFADFTSMKNIKRHFNTQRETKKSM